MPFLRIGYYALKTHSLFVQIAQFDLLHLPSQKGGAYLDQPDLCFVRQVADVRPVGNGSSSGRWQTLVRQVSPLRVNDYFKLFFN